MAFIRAYMDQGDPFRLRLPKGLRKLTLRKALQAAGPLAGFIPGIGGIAAQLAAAGADGGGSCAPQIDEYARTTDYGDPWLGGSYHPPAPAGNSGRRGVPPRPRNGKQSAGAGPATRVSGRPKQGGQHGAPSSHSTRGTTSARPKPQGGGLGGAVQDRLGGILEMARQGNLAGAVGTGILGTGRSGGGGSNAALAALGLGGGHRRSMNFTNVKALRRGLRRLEGFEKVVRRLEKAYPRMRHNKGHSCTSSCASKRRGK